VSDKMEHRAPHEMKPSRGSFSNYRLCTCWNFWLRCRVSDKKKSATHSKGCPCSFSRIFLLCCCLKNTVLVEGFIHFQQIRRVSWYWDYTAFWLRFRASSHKWSRTSFDPSLECILRGSFACFLSHLLLLL